MDSHLELQLEGSPIAFPVRRVLVAGYTGRDSKQVRAHIAELERQGIPAPASVPALYPVEPSLATTANQLAFAPGKISGEAEPALLFCSSSLKDALVSVIVDFTDREEERRSVERSKRLPKPLSSRVWRYRDVAASWDEITMRSWVERGHDAPYYQSGKLAQLLSPEQLLARLHPDALEGTVLLMGTLPLLSRQFLFTDYFGCELETPGHAKLSCECTLRHAIEVNP